MPLYIPWLTDTLKKKALSYLLNHYLGQFFEEKLTLEQLSVDIIKGQGSIKNLALDVDGLNDELDFIPFKFLHGCKIGNISVKVPWASLPGEACRVELDGAQFDCRLKTPADTKARCNESTTLTRSLMTSSMQMAEDIVTTSDDGYEHPEDSPMSDHSSLKHDPSTSKSDTKRKNPNQMFEGLEMFAQFIDSVLRRTKLTACNTLFRIHPHQKKSDPNQLGVSSATSTTSTEEFGDPMADSVIHETTSNDESSSTVEFFIKFFRCEEIIDQSNMQSDTNSYDNDSDANSSCPMNPMPETITKQLTLEDVEMRIDGSPVSNLVGKHTITIKFNGQKSEISIFLGSPLLAVISHHQLKTFFKVFENATESDMDSSMIVDPNQRVMNSEDYAKIETQLLETASLRNITQELRYQSSHHLSSHTGRRWMDGGEMFSDLNQTNHSQGYQLPKDTQDISLKGKRDTNATTTLDNLEAFSCELKLPGIWLCILKDGERLPPLIKPYADSNNSFSTINKYIDGYLNLPHLRLLALKVALNLTSSGIDVFLGDLDVSEYFQKDSLRPTLHLLRNDLGSGPIDSSRYKVRMKNHKELNIDLLTKTRLVLDPTIIDRMVFDYKLINVNEPVGQKKNETTIKRDSQLNISITLRGEQLKIELLCPIPDLSYEAQNKTTQLRPQSFLFEFNDICMKWHSDKLVVDAFDMSGFIKAQPTQVDSQTVKFIEASSQESNRICVTIEPSPSNLDTEFPDDVEQALNESSMFDSIYVDRGKESSIPMEVFETKRKLVKFSTSSDAPHSPDNESKEHECDSEKIVTPGSRQHLTDYLNQTNMSTKLFLNIQLPLCELEFEDKEQLDLIYNRFANDFVFWQPKITQQKNAKLDGKQPHKADKSLETHSAARNFNEDSISDRESEVSFHSIPGLDCPSLDLYENEMSLKLVVDNLLVRFSHQSCAQALKQELSVENLLLGVVIDVNRKPNTILSLVSDNLELASDSEIVLGENYYNNRNSAFALAVEIKRPTKNLKDIKLAIEVDDGLFRDFKTDTYTRFWRSINVTDEPITGYIAPEILTELHINIKDTALALVKEGARPALLTIDELYLTSMIMEKTSQLMIRSIADEISLFLKRDLDGPERIKNYVCLVNSSCLDLNFKLSQEGKIEFNVINSVITVRACQDSLSALFQLFSVLFKNGGAEKSISEPEVEPHNQQEECIDMSTLNMDQDSNYINHHQPQRTQWQEIGSGAIADSESQKGGSNLLEDAMNDYKELPKFCTQPEPEETSLDLFYEEYSDTLSDDPPLMQHTTGGSCNDNTCLLDESNPMLDNLFAQPLLPSKGDELIDKEDALGTSNVSVNDSAFFIIGDDDVGAGIIDRQQKEPVVRKLTDGPINIIDNYFKMTKPRTIPEMLALSLERYVLEEMTLVVSLFGGRDFNEEKPSERGSTTKEGSVAGDEDNISLGTHSKSPTFIRNRAASMTYEKQSAQPSTSTSSKVTGLPEYKPASLKARRSRKKHLSEGCKGVSEEPAARVRFGEGAVNLWESLDLMSSPDFKKYHMANKTRLSSDSKTAGGAWRRSDVCIQLSLSKVKLLYELAAADSPISWRFMLFIHDIEIRDKLQASDINKMLYEYCTESMPKRNTQILTIKNVATINPTDGCEECDLRVSIKPLRLNIDQDTLIFLIDFFTNVNKAFNSSTSSEQQPIATNYASQNTKTVHKPSSSSANQSTTPEVRNRAANLVKAPVTGPKSVCSDADSYHDTRSLHSLRSQTTTTYSRVGDDDTCSNISDLPTHCHRDPSDHQPLYIKSFTFSPDVPIRLDYHAKHLDFEQGALAGILMGLAHLDHSELVLKRVQTKHGMRGLDRVLLFVINSWLSDIKRNQLPSILGGVGPMHSVIQLFQGMRDLVWMPIDHYRKDKRLVRGLQRGASSFSSSTAMATINLMNHFISIIQCTAQIAHDIVTPPSMRPLSSARTSGAYRRAAGRGSLSRVSEYTSAGHNPSMNGATSSGLLNQPRNFCEGVAVGFSIIKDGLNDTARNVAVGMQADDVRSAMGELVRQIPSTLLSPIITATEGAQNVLVGIRNQIAPDARRQDQEKWKPRVRGK